MKDWSIFLKRLKPTALNIQKNPRLKSRPFWKIKTKGWWDDTWNTIEGWWSSATGAVNDWWNNGGKDVAAADASGAAQGAMAGIVVAVSTATIGWGVIPTMAVAGGVYEFFGQIITTWILN